MVIATTKVAMEFLQEGPGAMKIKIIVKETALENGVREDIVTGMDATEYPQKAGVIKKR